MAANSRMASAVQILCVMAYKGPDGTNAEIISRSLRTNPVVVRRLLKCLEKVGLVEIRPGKDGGAKLLRDPAEITLEEVYKAVENETDVFALRQSGNPNCPVNSRMKGLLGPIFEAASEAVNETLGRTTIRALVQEIP
jgi:Rrf2 family protein